MEFTRVQIAVEGEDTEEWYIIEPGVLKWDEWMTYPIVEGSNFDVAPLGYAKNIVREPDGRITADVPDELILRYDAREKLGGQPLVRFGTYVTKVEMTNVDSGPEEKKRVTNCVLTAIGRIPNVNGANPGAKLTKASTDDD